MGSKRKKGEDNGGGGDGKEMITDSRFSKAHTDPKWRRLPRRESKVTIDSRFKGVLTDKASAPVDKRGKRRRRGSAKDSLKEYYRIDEDDKKKKKQKSKEDSEEEESEGEEKLMALEAEARLRKQSECEEESDDGELKSEEKKLPLKLASSDEESDDESAESEGQDSGDVSVEEEEVDTDEDDEAMYDDDEPEVAEEIASIEKETHRLAAVNMDWRYVSAKDLYVVFNSFLPKDGRLLSVTVYPSDFGLERMKEEEIHGPAIGGDKKNDDNSDEEDDEEEEDEAVVNERLRDYEKTRLRYYFAVTECDSSATADYLYKHCDGIEFERSSNKLDLRFIPDSMEFKHPPRDVATEAPATYQGLDFQSRALQMSRVNVSWDEDEPHRVRTLNRKFDPDQLAELELKEFLASDESESDDDDGGDDDEEKRKEKYLALMESGDVDSDKDEDEENDQDMVVEFNTGLEDLSNKFREKKEEKPETVWEAQLRKMREKKKARRMQKKDDDDDSSDNDDDDDDDDSSDDDHKKKKKKKMMNKKKKGLEEKLAADERSLAELELIVADENGGAGKGLRGYNIKGKGKKRSKEMAEDKIPSADPDDSRFSVAFTDPNYALDPTNPQFKRSATYVKQLNQKQKEDPRSQEEQVKDVETKKASTTDGTVGSSKKRNFAESAAVKSLKLKMQQKGSEKKKEGTADLAQRLKKKAKALSNK